MIFPFFTLGNMVTWAVCSILIYLSLNFRLYMIFHHPGRKLKAKVRERRASRGSAIDSLDLRPDSKIPVWERECLQQPCFARSGNFNDTETGETRRAS
jgi:hypothetical protein